MKSVPSAAIPCNAVALLLLALGLAGSPSRAGEAPAPEGPTPEELFRQQAVTVPPSTDPHDFKGVWWPDRSYALKAPAPKLKPGVPPPAQQLGPSENNSIVKCMPAVRFNSVGSGMSDLYVQSPTQLTMIAEEDHDIRQIYLNQPPPRHLTPSLTGYSFGRWDGDTLVITTVGLKDPDGTARPTLRVTERLRKVRNGTYLEHTVTFDDPRRYIEPYTFVWAARWRPDIHIAENICEEEYQDYKLENGSIKYSTEKVPEPSSNEK